jgi:hypothetical protein
MALVALQILALSAVAIPYHQGWHEDASPPHKIAWTEAERRVGFKFFTPKALGGQTPSYKEAQFYPTTSRRKNVTLLFASFDDKKATRVEITEWDQENKVPPSNGFLIFPIYQKHIKFGEAGLPQGVSFSFYESKKGYAALFVRSAHSAEFNRLNKSFEGAGWTWAGGSK